MPKKIVNFRHRHAGMIFPVSIIINIMRDLYYLTLIKIEELNFPSALYLPILNFFMHS